MKRLEKSSLRFIKEKNYLKPEEIGDYKKYFVVIDKDNNIIDSILTYLRDNLYEICARDRDGEVLKRIVEVRFKNSENGIELPRPIKKYR